ncbi:MULTISPECIES: DMT family transporter [unclassified Spongiibacter]|uniref:DMT family transporter n=1 Tax=Spongiibacter TaxID=630749 RepID=UPI00257AFDCA|nr:MULTISPECIES: DMT family transporter [unclassified Spongiibacter]
MDALHHQQTPRAAAWMAGALASFSTMAISARELSGEIAVHQQLFFRSAIGLLCLLLIMLVARLSRSNRVESSALRLRSQRPGLHVLRNVFHFGGQYGWFVGIGLLPLAEVFALEFTVPFWTMLIAAVALNEAITRRKLIAIVMGLLGVLAIVQPGYSIVDSASLIVLAAAIGYAVSHTCTKALGGADSPFTIVFYMCLVQLPIGFALSIAHWQWPYSEQWVWLLLIGLMALSAHFCMSKAMHYAEVSVVVTLDFLRLPLIALLGVVLYAEAFDWAILLGGTLMLAGNIIALQPLRKHGRAR